MEKIERLVLQTGGDIPFVGARVNVHQPTLNEIGLMGESKFFVGVQFLLFDKNYLNDEDKRSLENRHEFDIFMEIIRSNNILNHYKENAIMLLSLLFPEHEIRLKKHEILLQHENIQLVSSITKDNFFEFQYIIRSMFGLDGEEQNKYNPKDKIAARIAEKIRKGKQKIAGKKGTDADDVSIFSNYISILSVGLHKDKNQLKEYTIYQIKDEFKRYQMWLNSDIYLRAKMAGAEGMEEVEDWMGDMHP